MGSCESVVIGVLRGLENSWSACSNAKRRKEGLYPRAKRWEWNLDSERVLSLSFVVSLRMRKTPPFTNPVRTDGVCAELGGM